MDKRMNELTEKVGGVDKKEADLEKTVKELQDEVGKADMSKLETLVKEFVEAYLL
eukprot:CAMPEP_0182578614 /NCGR_PEP_ID=MMETSP1324-20130603/41570_1 /TAXON_ID=236786 /ORGANISM="Florenciella sp., Strain RCC1587" /LENGTH=54 /DNA_ID=CAMNT_0024794583 /DNA_START=29 /DNA_END=190 /DNA_ORIENTATION=+